MAKKYLFQYKNPQGNIAVKQGDIEEMKRLQAAGTLLKAGPVTEANIKAWSTLATPTSKPKPTAPISTGNVGEIGTWIDSRTGQGYSGRKRNVGDTAVSARTKATETPTGQTYTIQRGDTLSAIAARNNTTVQALMAANPNIRDPNLIYAGASLAIPGVSSKKEEWHPPMVLPDSKKEEWHPPMVLPDSKKEEWHPPMVLPDTKKDAGAGAGIGSKIGTGAGAKVGAGVNIQNNQKQIDDIDDQENQQQEDELEIIDSEGDKVDTSDSSKLIKSLLEKLDEAPEAKSAQEIFNEQRKELGIGGLEDDLADIDSQIESLEADFASTIEREEGRRVSMGQIRKRQSAQEIKYNRMKRDLQVERNSIANQLNMKYGVLNSMVKFAGMDYDNAQQDYQFQFNAALQLTNLLTTMENREKTDEERKTDNARANIQIMYNLFKSGNISYDALDQATLLEMKNMELQSGFPGGFMKFIDEKIEDPIVSFLPGFTDEDGNRVQPVATVSPNGKYTISNIKVGKVKTKEETKDIISQAKINQLAAAGVPQAIAEDIQRSLNAGVTKPTIIAHLDKQLGQGKGKEMMDTYDSIMSDTIYQF